MSFRTSIANKIGFRIIPNVSKVTRNMSTTFPVPLQKSSLFQTGNFINNKFVPSISGKTVDVTNPGNHELVSSVAHSDAADVKVAIAAASEAQAAWSQVPVAERCRMVKKWGELMLENKVDLGTILTVEQGKPLAEAIGEIAYSASFCKFFSENGVDLMEDEVLKERSATESLRIVVHKEPVGVVGVITPWNFPSAMITRKAAAGLIAGCTFVIKPSELTPFSALACGVLAIEAGIPPGVFNVVVGDAQSIGNEISQNPAVKKITFTGSTRVGKLLMAQAADTVKRMSMELGGNAPFIVFDDADVDEAVKCAMMGKGRNAGQTCVSPNRFLVQEHIHDKFVAKMSEAYSKTVVGYGLTEGVLQGPLINQAAVKKVDDQVQDAVAKGANVICGGHKVTIDGVSLEDSLYYAPTLLVGATKDMLCYKEETFGPLIPVFKFSTVDEAISLANDTDAGLASYFFTNNEDIKSKVSRSLEYGMVACNAGSVSNAIAPFGGVKHSGIGSEGSARGINEYVSVKAFHTNL